MESVRFAPRGRSRAISTGAADVNDSLPNASSPHSVSTAHRDVDGDTPSGCGTISPSNTPAPLKAEVLDAMEEKKQTDISLVNAVRVLEDRPRVKEENNSA